MTWIPFADHLIAHDEDNTAHAVPMTIATGSPVQPAVCGKTNLTLYAVRTCVQQGGEYVEDAIVIAWPPRVARWKELNGGGRCRECYEKTGKPRVAKGSFEEVVAADPVFGPCDKAREQATA